MRHPISACVASVLATFASAAPFHAQDTAPSAALAALQVGRGEVQDLILPAAAGHPFETWLFVDGSPRKLSLQPRSLRAPGFKLLVQGEDGELHEQVPAPPATYRGTVEGYPDSLVAASLLDGQLLGSFRLRPGEELWGIQPLDDLVASAPHSAHVVFDAGDSLPGDAACGTDELGERAPAPGPSAPGGGATGKQITEIACDADFPFFQQNGSSVAATQADVENVINAVDSIYDADVEILYQITAIIVRSTNPDPYTASDPGSLLNEFRQHWNGNHGDIQRDVAHLFTGTNLDGSVIGIASLSVVCFVPSAYGLSQSRFTNNFTSRVGLTAHELGHNWAALHCNDDTDCKIMCSGLGGCTGILTSFGTAAVDAILGKKASSFCFTPAVPPPLPLINQLKPVAGVQVLSPAEVTLLGTDFETTSSITVNGATLPSSAWQVVNDSKVILSPPQGAVIGTVPVTLTNFSGVSNTMDLTYVATDPAQLSVATSIPILNPVMSWTYGSDAFEAAVLVLSGSPITVDFLGLTLLLNGFQLHSQFLDAAGLGSFSLTLPPLPLATQLYSQLITFDGVEFNATPVKFSAISLM